LSLEKVFGKSSPAAVAILLALSGILFAPHPVVAARYSCNLNPDGNHRVDVVPNDEGRPSEVHSFFERPLAPARSGDGSITRRLVVHYTGESIAVPWRISLLRVNYGAYVKTPKKAIYAFLTLESGERFTHLVEDSIGVSQIYRGNRRITDETWAQFEVRDKAFLAALERSKTLAIDLKYADGESLAREIVDMSRPARMQELFDTASEMAKDYKKNCKYIEPPHIEI
jgi:hypothetical protein